MKKRSAKTIFRHHLRKCAFFLLSSSNNFSIWRTNSQARIAKIGVDRSFCFFVDFLRFYGIVILQIRKCDEEKNRFWRPKRAGDGVSPAERPAGGRFRAACESRTGVPVTGRSSDAPAGCHQGGTVEHGFAPDRWQRFFFFLINSYLEAVPYGSEKVRSE